MSKIFIEGKILTSLTDNLVEFVKAVFVDISTSGQIPNEIVKTIIEKIAQSRITATIKSILRDYYNGTKIVNTDMFKFFERYFREPNKLKNHEDDFTGTILDRVIQDEQCRDIILEHSSFYSEIVKLAKDDAEEFKVKIKDLYSSQPSDILRKFVEAIGVSFEQQGE